ncbi:BlaI/MecI/CopY family transcriptional regulator [Flavihumibacter sp. UBA7668]|uniref:BlaI/MecI/CopY family transcriptional regulator n=1 Tax=Flavihumibacter sp. UBA7668 TaxID=1946542 RepID=UPI0025C65588|nr:BlaI/MecI/CopY family transcriptional regulator [Flavihumibacter sp. UBA7668]
MDKLSLPEEQAMQSIWQIGEGNVKAFLEKMPEPQPPYTTLASTVKNLEKKGYLKSRMIGNTYVYRPTITEEEYKKRFMKDFIQGYFDNSYKAMVNFFIEQEQMSKEELKEILDMIEGKKSN